MTREEILNGLRESPKVDVCVVGGGINGISVFRELTLQGLSVLLVEKHDYCSGASAALSRMVHGGLRYLENGEFSLVRNLWLSVTGCCAMRRIWYTRCQPQFRCLVSFQDLRIVLCGF